MVSKALVVAAALALPGCLPEAVFHCLRDEQCDRGTDPRCQGGVCTALDLTCPSGRRYDDTAGQAEACVAGAAYLLADPCLTDQPPPLAEGCAATVCAELPQCCEFGWTDACVQWAELACPGLTCTAELAVASSRGGMDQPVRVVSGPRWGQVELPLAGPWLDWLAPADDRLSPRLAVGAGNAIQRLTPPSGEVDRVDTGDQAPRMAASVDLDHAGAPVLTWAGSNADGGIIGAERAGNLPMVVVAGATFLQLLWGPVDGDAATDVVALRGGSYEGFAQVAADPPLRSLFNSGGLRGPRRVATWGDVDGDHALDLVIIDANVRIHSGATGISERTDYATCVVELPVGGCDAQLSATGAVGPLVPGPDGRRQSDVLVVAQSSPPRVVLLTGLHQRGQPMPGVTPPIEPTVTELTLDLGATGPGGGVPVAAVVLRDVDGDDDLDALLIHDQGAIVIGTNTGELGPDLFTWELGFRIPDLAPPQGTDPLLDVDLTGRRQ